MGKPRGPKSRSSVALAAALMAVAFLGVVWWFGLDPADVGDIALDGIGDAAGGASAALDGISGAARETSDIVEGLRPAISTVDGSAADPPDGPPERAGKLTAEPPGAPAAGAPQSPLET